MDRPDERDREIAGLRECLSRLNDASLRINESLDFDTVLQGVFDSARSLTEARLRGDDAPRRWRAGTGFPIVRDDLGWGRTTLVMPERWRLYEYLGRISRSLRLTDLLGHVRSAGLPESPPTPGGGAGRRLSCGAWLPNGKAS